MYDDLERELDKAFGKKGINARFEGIFAKGGNMYAKEDKEMLHSQTNQIKHHASEMESVIDKQKHIEPWVVSKMGRATSDLSDVTHYLDGRTKMENGGNIMIGDKIKLDDDGVIRIYTVTNPGMRRPNERLREGEFYLTSPGVIGFDASAEWIKENRIDKEEMANGGIVKPGDEVLYRNEDWVVADLTKNKIYLTNGPVTLDLPISETSRITLNTRKLSTGETPHKDLSKQIKEKGVWSFKNGGGVGYVKFDNDRFNSNISDKWDNLNKITQDIGLFLITAYEASGDELTNDIISAIEKGIKSFGIYTQDK